jgi:hypothetical protein
MKLLIIGCEYSGTTTLAVAINDWLREQTGTDFRIIHDHWKIPHTSGHLPFDTSHFLNEEEQAEVLALSPKLKEMTQRHSLYYHMPRGQTDANMVLVGYLFDDGIYGAHYFEYGRPIDPEDRRIVGRHVEHGFLAEAPDTVLLLLRTDADVIRKRMQTAPHPAGVLQEQDIEFIQGRFEEEFKASLFSRKFVLDTSSATLYETMAEFAEAIQPHLSEVDRSRILAHKALRGGGG